MAKTKTAKARAVYTRQTDEAIERINRAIETILGDRGTTTEEKGRILSEISNETLDRMWEVAVLLRDAPSAPDPAAPEADLSSQAIARRIEAGEDLGTRFEETKI